MPPIGLELAEGKRVVSQQAMQHTSKQATTQYVTKLYVHVGLFFTFSIYFHKNFCWALSKNIELLILNFKHLYYPRLRFSLV